MARSLKISTSVLPRFLLLLFVLPALAGAADGRTEFGGHTKLNVVGQSYPSDSVFREVYGSHTSDTQGELRLNISHRRSGWTFDANYQLVAMYTDTFVLPDDRRRYFDLTSVIDEGSKSALVHRLDRLSLGYTSEKFVARLGRQALSWGNALFYAPMDLVNPFDPATIDVEYKAGDDLLYMQYLVDSGSDVQGAHVVRRNYLSGDVDSRSATTAVKYHGFAGAGEFDILLARHYQDDVLGFGASHALGGAHWSGDLVITDTDTDSYVQLSTNLSYSWTWHGKNMSGAVEYHFNGMGQPSGEYDLPSIAQNPDLLLRLARGESFALGRHYLAGSVMIEMTPLWSVTPTLLMNAGDPSGLLQMVSQYSLSDNMTLLGSLNIPMGSNGSEFGGVVSEVPGRYLSSGAGIFAQLAWYF